ncbi:MAG: sulfatase-like hydrolase/transferase [Bacteroidota bacterium]
MKKPNVLYILADQFRAQATGYNGDPNARTPNIDKLASMSVNFKTAVSTSPVCTPYRSALMTGRYPLSTGMFMNDLYLPSEEYCMAEMYKDAGYETGYIGKWHLDGHGRLAFTPKERRQGFDYWKALECSHDYNNSYYYYDGDTARHKWEGYDAYSQTKDAQVYIKNHANDDEPFLLMISYGIPHFPHGSAPEELKALYPPDSIVLRPNVPDSRKERALKEAQGYYAHIMAFDKCMGDLMKTLDEAGVAENTIVVFTSDHGEMMGSQDQSPLEKQRPWDESIRVPFLIRYPATYGTSGYEVNAPLGTPDILPTLLSMSGVEIPNSIEGEDLTKYITENGVQEDRTALIMNVYPFAGYSDGDAWRGIRTTRYTYVRKQDQPWLLYDNQEDPYQMQNLVNSETHNDLQKELEERLQTMLKERGDQFLPKEEYLTEWGYVVNERNKEIPYKPYETKVQSPAFKPN